ncbi:hypothetical protein GGI07_002083 [Coemansia sp. Benny D115]|nr:hypothetical protein GGI07_002083 [Coemansia sp. Benny D115]
MSFTQVADKPARRKPAKRSPRHFVEEPLYLLPAHFALLQESTAELLRGLATASAIEEDPLFFDQLLGAAVNVKHAFDLGRMDVLNGTLRPRNTSLCHECITTVSSVWRSGPEGPRSLCNACGLRFYKQNQRRALEAKRRVCVGAENAAPEQEQEEEEEEDVDVDDDEDEAPVTRPSIANLCRTPTPPPKLHMSSIRNILADSDSQG